MKKSDSRIWTVGELDELAAVLGLAISFSKNQKVIKEIEEIQHDLFLICAGETAGLKKRTSDLEKAIDEIDKDLPVLKNFIFIGGSRSAGFLHLARSVCRRVERRVVALDEKEGLEGKKGILVYLNRLSDFLFVLARFENFKNKVEEKILKK